MHHIMGDAVSNELDDQDKPLAAATGGGWDEQAQSLAVVDEAAPSSSAPLGIGAAVPTWISLAMINVLVAIPMLLIMWGLGSIISAAIWDKLLVGALVKEGLITGASPWGLAGALVMFTGVLVWSVMSRQLERQRAEELDALEPMRLGHISRTLSICFGCSTSLGILALIWRVLSTPTESWLLAFVLELNCVVDSALIFWSLLKFDAESFEAWWQRCKRSPYFAGATTATGIGIVLGGAILVLSFAVAFSALEDIFKDPERLAELEAAIVEEAAAEQTLAAPSVAPPQDDAQVMAWVRPKRPNAGTRWTFASAPAVLGMSDGGGLSIASFGQTSARQPRVKRGCMEAVWADEGDGTSAFEKGVRFLRYRKRMTYEDAEDVAMMTLLKVCIKDDESPLNHVNSYFMKAVRNNACTFQRRQAREGFGVSCEVLQTSNTCEDHEQLERMSKALCSLTADEHYLVMRLMGGAKSAELGRELGISDSAVRKRFERIKARLRLEMLEVER